MNWAQPFFSSYGASSLNTCAYCGRLRDLPIVRGRESCDGCGAPIFRVRIVPTQGVPANEVLVASPGREPGSFSAVKLTNVRP